MKILCVGDFHGKVPVKLKKAIKKENFDLVIGLGDYAGIEEWRPYILYLFGLEDKAERMSPVEFFGEKGFADLMEKDFKGGERILDYLSELGVPFISIFGNGDDEWYDYPFEEGLLDLDEGRDKYLSGLKNFKDINYGSCNFEGASIVGFGGYMDAKENYDKKGEGYPNVLRRIGDSKKRLWKIIGKAEGKSDIFVFHYPPKGVFDIVNEEGNKYNGKSVGVDAFREAVLKEKPALVLCGHMHEYQGKEMLGESLVLNPGAAVEGKFAVVEFDVVKGRVKNVEFVK